LVETLPKGEITDDFSVRKRKGGIKLDEDDDEVSNHEESEDEEDVVEDATEEKDNLKTKQRIDELWETFKQDTAAVRPASSLKKKVDDGASTSSVVKQEEKKVPKKVEVTEIFDFAGEEVKYVMILYH
jgi:hypothetical protein